MKQHYHFATTLIVTLFCLLLTHGVQAQVSVWNGTYAPWTNGTGTEADPFLIENAQQLAYLTYRVNNGLDAAGGHVSNHDLYYKLMTDVNLNGSQSFQWTPIGYWNSNTDYYCFGGHFDGNNHTVSGLYINSSANRVGFFGYTDGAEIKNLSVSGNRIASETSSGGIVGHASGITSIDNCSSNCNIYSNNTSYSYSGGIIGKTDGTTTINNCNNSGSISSNSTYIGGRSYSGGIIGSSSATVKIVNCYNTGNITSLSSNTNSGNFYSYSGGILGDATSTAFLINNYNIGLVSSASYGSQYYTSSHLYSYSGGVLGSTSASTTIINCYNRGAISSDASYLGQKSTHSGGITGLSGNSIFIENCYNTGTLSAPYNNPGGIISISGQSFSVTNSYYLNTCGGTNTYGGSPMSSAAMQTSDFVNILNNGSCAFEQDLIPFSNSGYPTLTMIVHEVATLEANNVTQSHAGLKGTIFVENDVILSAGFMYKPSTANDFLFVTINNANDTINYTLSNLSPSTSYSYKTFIVTAGCDTTFGETKNFTTSPISITTNNASNITQTHSTLNGTFSIGDATIAAQGFEYKKSTDTEYQTINVSGSGNVEQTIANLIPGTQYTYRAFCTAVGCSTIYGTSKTFTTSAVSVTTGYSPSNVTQAQATLHGNLSMGDATVTNQGFEYKQIGGNWVQVTVPYSDNISYTLSNLIPNTQYSYRVFATANECGTIYGQIRSFTTSSVSATTNNATNITQTHATLNGSFTIGDANISSYGFEYRKITDTVFQTVTVSGEGSVSETVTGLTPNTQYTYRTFCTAVGCETVYGNYRNFTTQTVSVTTNATTNLTESSATLNGSMSMGDATVTNQGFEYRAVGEANFTTVNATGGSDNFSTTLYGLPVNTFYEYRAFVTIAENTEPYYGAIQSFEVSWLNADTILIYDADMLQWVADRCNSGTTFYGKYIKLMNNIVLPLNQPNNMTSIGRYPNYPFGGTFDGNGMTITNLYIDQPNTEYQGFFGYTLSANLYEVGLVNITASGRNYTGGMVAYAENTYMRDCYVNGGSLFALSYCGGLVGYQDEGTNSIISGCYNTCTVSGNHYVGGLVGFSNYSTVRNSYVAASVTGQGYGIGAIIGGAEEVLMYNCYFSSAITGQNYAIGENNFKDNEGMTDEEMRDPAFVATLNQGLVVPVWKSDYSAPINNGFPILIWQYSDAEACEAPENLNYTVSGNTATLTWNGGENASYYIVEYGTSGSDVHTENTVNHQMIINNLLNGNYFWRVKSVCSFGESNFVNGNTITVGINDYDNIGSHIQLYPNPSHNFTAILLHQEEQDLDMIQVLDVNGKTLLSEKSTGKEHLLNTEMLKPGIYFVRISTTGNRVATLKLIVN